DLIDPAATTPFDRAEAEFAARLALTGTWFSPAPRSFEVFIDRYRTHFNGAGPIWLLPVILERGWIGGILVAADPRRVADWHAESDQIKALVATLGLTLAHARAQADAITLGEELTEANRRSAAAVAATWRARMLESVVSMAAGAAHEMNNPLAVISGRAQ